MDRRPKKGLELVVAVLGLRIDASLDLRVQHRFHIMERKEQADDTDLHEAKQTKNKGIYGDSNWSQ